MAYIKRFLAFLLAVLMLPWGMAVPASAAQSDIASIVSEAYNEFAADNNVESGSYHGTMQMINHALSGKGKDLYLTEGDDFTAVILNSVMFKTAVTDALTFILEKMVESCDANAYLKGGIHWYDEDYRYYVNHCVDHGTDDPEESSIIATAAMAKPYEGARNSYDDAMVLVAGGTTLQIWLEKTSADEESMTYRVVLQLSDRFDFVNDEGEFTNSDEGLSLVLNLLGTLLALGGSIETFYWEMNADLEITIPNHCPHRTFSYQWNHDGQEFYSETDGGFDENPILAIYTQGEKDKKPYPYFQIENTVNLDHGMPWVVEFRLKGNTNFTLGPDNGYRLGRPFLLKVGKYVVGGEVERQEEIDPETGEPHVRTYWSEYGLCYADYGYSHNQIHAYRLENRVSEDGSNMVWLTVDGEELGPMTHHYTKVSDQMQDMEQQVDWFNGVDFEINYICNSGWRAREDLFTFDYIRIWENGEGKGAYNYYRPAWTEGSCETGGTVTHTCAICGASYSEASGAGHFYDAPRFVWDRFGGCTAEYVCIICGSVQTAECDVTTEQNGETLVYTAVTEHDGQVYSDKRTIPVPDYIPGDINSDGKVNNRDAARLMQHLAGWDAEVTEAALDTTGDGKINNRDAARLMQYLAGWDVELN